MIFKNLPLISLSDTPSWSPKCFYHAKNKPAKLFTFLHSLSLTNDVMPFIEKLFIKGFLNFQIDWLKLYLKICLTQ